MARAVEVVIGSENEGHLGLAGLRMGVRLINKPENSIAT
jgi:hypothetical protein